MIFDWVGSWITAYGIRKYSKRFPSFLYVETTHYLRKVISWDPGINVPSTNIAAMITTMIATSICSVLRNSDPIIRLLAQGMSSKRDALERLIERRLNGTAKGKFQGKPGPEVRPGCPRLARRLVWQRD